MLGSFFTDVAPGVVDPVEITISGESIISVGGTGNTRRRLGRIPSSNALGRSLQAGLSYPAEFELEPLELRPTSTSASASTSTTSMIMSAVSGATAVFLAYY